MAISWYFTGALIKDGSDLVVNGFGAFLESPSVMDEFLNVENFGLEKGGGACTADAESNRVRGIEDGD